MERPDLFLGNRGLGISGLNCKSSYQITTCVSGAIANALEKQAFFARIAVDQEMRLGPRTLAVGCINNEYIKNCNLKCASGRRRAKK